MDMFGIALVLGIMAGSKFDAARKWKKIMRKQGGRNRDNWALAYDQRKFCTEEGWIIGGFAAGALLSALLT